MNVVKLPFYARLALVMLAVILVLFFLMEGGEIIIPLVFGLLISVLLYPLTRFFETRLHLGRSTAAIISVFIFITSIVAFFYFLTIQVIAFSEDLPELQKKIQAILQSVQHWIATEYHVNTKQQTDYLNKSATGIIATAANSIGNTFVSFLTFALWTIFVFIYTYFMIYYRRLLLRFVLHLFKPQHREQVYEVVTETRSMLNSYVLGLLTEMVILSVVNCSMFWIMGIQYALLLGVMAAVLNIIPYIGIYTATAFAMLVTFTNGGGNEALEVGIGLLSVHFIDANILMPRIVGSRVKINPLITIISVIIGHFIWGIPGMFLFVPITATLKIVCERVDGLQAWAILIGKEDKEPVKKKVKLNLGK